MDFVSEFRSDLELRQLRKHTVENYISDIRHFLVYNPNPCKVTKSDLQEYLHVLLDKDLAASTLKSYFISLNAFYEFLDHEDICKDNLIPAFRKRYLPKRCSQEKRQDIPIDTARTIIKRAGHILDKAIHILLAKTGIRRQELLILKETDLKIDDWLIMAPLTGKRLDFRPVFLDEEAMLVMLDYLDWRDEYAQSDYLFVSPTTGRQLHKDYPGNYLRKVGVQLGIHNPDGSLDEKLTPHCWRWFFTTRMFTAGMCEQYIKYLRGDVLATKAAWEGYLSIDKDLVRMEYLRCSPILL
jgi:integrase/recombinase XerD